MKHNDAAEPAARMVVRTLDLLEAMSSAAAPLSLTQLAAGLGLPKTTMFRMLQALEERRYVLRDPASKAYLAGPALFLSDRRLARRALSASARVFLQALAAETGETAHLAVLDEDRITYLDVVEPTTRIRAWIKPGEAAPANCVASGKAILALSPADVQARFLRGKLPRFTEASLDDPERLKRALDRARRQGFATNHGEWERDIFGLSAPVTGPGGHAIAAIGISGPSSRFQSDRVKFLAPLVTRQAAGLSVLLRPASQPRAKRKHEHG